MTAGEVAQLITSIATLIGVLRVTRKVAQVDTKVETVHAATNSKMDKLLKLTAEASKAEGVKEEQDRVK